MLFMYMYMYMYIYMYTAYYGQVLQIPPKYVHVYSETSE